MSNSTNLQVPELSVKAELDQWVTKIAAATKANNIHWCDGSQKEYDDMCQLLVQKGTFIPLNHEKRQIGRAHV